MLEIRWASATIAELPPSNSWLGTRERALLARMRAKPRRDSFLLGRLAGKRLLGDAVELLPAPEGAPYAVQGDAQLGLAVSISHRAGLAVCAAAVGAVVLGCDVEQIEPRSDAFLHDFLTPAERTCVAAASDKAQCANLIWSAKESALKALRVGLARDTQELEVTHSLYSSWDGVRVDVRHLHSASGSEPDARAARLADLCVIDRKSGRRLAGGWRRLDDFVLTLVCEPAW